MADDNLYPAQASSDDPPRLDRAQALARIAELTEQRAADTKTIAALSAELNGGTHSGTSLRDRIAELEEANKRLLAENETLDKREWDRAALRVAAEKQQERIAQLEAELVEVRNKEQIPIQLLRRGRCWLTESNHVLMRGGGSCCGMNLTTGMEISSALAEQCVRPLPIGSKFVLTDDGLMLSE